MRDAGTAAGAPPPSFPPSRPLTDEDSGLLRVDPQVERVGLPRRGPHPAQAERPAQQRRTQPPRRGHAPRPPLPSRSRPRPSPLRRLCRCAPPPAGGRGRAGRGGDVARGSAPSVFFPKKVFCLFACFLNAEASRDG